MLISAPGPPRESGSDRTSANPERLDALLLDQSPNAFASYVDELLDAPAHAEHWGRHWLDVARYAESVGEKTTSRTPTHGGTEIG